MQRLRDSGIKFERSEAEKWQRKDALKRQRNLCGECGNEVKLGLLTSGYALCEYDGKVCCKSCHVGDLRLIPARCVCAIV